MSLLQQQQFLARLLTDVELRKQFEQDGPGTLKLSGINGPDAKAILALAQAQLKLFAESLLQKRLYMVSKMLPRSSQVMGTEFKTLFKQYAQNSIPDLPQKHLQDALQFVSWLKLNLPAEQASLCELLDFEAVDLKTRLPGRGLIFRQYHFAVWQEDFDKRSSALCLWLRVQPDANWWHLRLPIWSHLYKVKINQ